MDIRRPADTVEVWMKEKPGERRHAELRSSQNCPQCSMTWKPKELFQWSPRILPETTHIVWQRPNPLKKKKKKKECTALKSEIITKAVIFTGLYPHVLLWHCNPHTSE